MEGFISKKFKDIDISKQEGQTKEGQSANYLDRLEDISKKERGLEILTERYLKKYTLNTEDKELLERMAIDLYNSEKQKLINEGHGGDKLEELTEETKARYIEEIKRKAEVQKKSLNNIVEYVSNNEDQHENWFRYFILRSVAKMGQIDTENTKYTHRTETTIAPFINLNHAAVGFVKQMLEQKHNINTLALNQDEIDISKKQDQPKKYRKNLLQSKKEAGTQGIFNSLGIDSKEYELFKQKLDTESFSDLYAFAQEKLFKDIEIFSTDGVWRKFAQGSDPDILVETLKNQGTNWCTETGNAPQHLEGGDFYVYYIRNHEEFDRAQEGEDVKPTQPAIAIRMVNGQVKEVRGIGPGQELSPELTDIAAEKYKDLPGGDKFEKKRDDMNRLTKLYGNPENMTGDDLRFLYETEGKIEGFGYNKDPRIEELKENRDKREDFVSIYNVSPEEVALTQDDATLETKVILGEFKYTKPEDVDILQNLLYVGGKTDFRGCTSLTSIPDNITFIRGAFFEGCTSLTSIPDNITFNGNASFRGCTSLTSIPDNITFNGNASFRGCTSLTSIPDNITFNRGAFFEGCTSLTSIPDNITFYEDAFFEGCTSLTSIPDNITFYEDAYFKGCTSLTLIPDNITFYGDAYFKGCTSLTSIPDNITFNRGAYFIDCTSLTSIPDNITFSEVTYFNDCTSLTSIPDNIIFYGDAYFKGCTSLTSIPDNITFNGNAFFGNCTSLTKEAVEQLKEMEKDGRIKGFLFL